MDGLRIPETMNLQMMVQQISGVPGRRCVELQGLVWQGSHPLALAALPVLHLGSPMPRMSLMEALRRSRVRKPRRKECSIMWRKGPHSWGEGGTPDREARKKWWLSMAQLA